jgi:transposase
MPIPLREDFDAAELRREARKSKDSGQARRLLALAAIYDVSTRTEAAKIGGVTLQIVRDWVLKFNVHGPSGLIAGKAPGQTPRLTAEHRAALACMVEDGPIPAVHGVVRWRLVDLCQWVFEEFKVAVSTQTMSRELRAMDYRKLSAKPRHHAQAAGAIEDFGKVSRHAWRKSHAKRASSRRYRSLVRRRGARRPEEQDHPTLGEARNAALSAERPAHRLDLHLRRDLPERRQGGRSDPAEVQHRSDAVASQ